MRARIIKDNKFFAGINNISSFIIEPDDDYTIHVFAEGLKHTLIFKLGENRELAAKHLDRALVQQTFCNLDGLTDIFITQITKSKDCRFIIDEVKNER